MSILSARGSEITEEIPKYPVALHLKRQQIWQIFLTENAAPARIVSDTIVGPTGQEAVRSGMISFIGSFFVILLFMVFYYSKSAGTIADIALLANVFFTFGVLASLALF